MGKLCAGRRGSVAKTCSAMTPPERRGRSCWTRGNKLPQESLKRSALICRRSWSIAPTSAPRCMCATRNAGEVRRHHELLPLMCIDRSQRGKGQDERTEERYFHDQPREPHRLSRVLTPRRVRTLSVRDATANSMSSTPLRGSILRCRGWSLAGTACMLIKACHDGAVVCTWNANDWNQWSSSSARVNDDGWSSGS